ncbi:hypothetical protein [Streptomyces sp. NPDC015125]|uniref:hypothetical protein n=1 Tax=Streptomyces sp. NPDC015125 TaxID=3364938 RepID=UPI0036F842B1
MVDTAHAPVLSESIAHLESAVPRLEECEKQLKSDLHAVSQELESAREALRHLRALTGVGVLSAGEEGVHISPTASAVAELVSEQAGSVATEPEPDSTPDQGVLGTEGAVASLPGPRDESPASEPADSGKPTVVAPEKPAGERAAAERAPRKKTGARSTATKKSAANKSLPAKSSAKKKAPAKAAAKKTTVAKTAAKKTTVAKTAGRRSQADQKPGTLLDKALEVLRNSESPLPVAEINEALGRGATKGQIESLRNTLDRAARSTAATRPTRPGRGLYAVV